MKRLNGMDAMLLYSETPNLHTHTLKVAIIDGASRPDGYSFEVFRHAVQQRLYLLDPLRYRLIEVPGRIHHPMWLQNCGVDLDYHVRRVTARAPGGRRELDQLIGEIASTPLDRSQPLWEFYFVEGMAEQRFALIGKVHHTLADGVASANLLSRLMDPQDGSSVTYAAAPASRIPSRAALLRAAARDHLEQAAALPGLIADIVRGVIRLARSAHGQRRHPDMARIFQAPPTFLNHVVSPGRTFATAALSLDEVKETARSLQVKFNDVILATVAQALRELLLHYDGRSDRPILASVPVATDRSTDRVTGNEISGFITSLPVHVADPLERVRLTALGTRRAKADHDLFGPSVQGRMMEYLPPLLAPALFRLQARTARRNRLMNIAVSNVAGPTRRGAIGGASVTEIYSVGVLSAGSALNITVWSYVDQVGISVLSDDCTFDDVHEVTAAMVRGFADIRSAAGLSGQLAPVPTAMPAALLAG